MVNLDLTRVVVTGLGAITPWGIQNPYWQGLIKGRRPLTRLTLFNASRLACQIAG
jgi:3-oxoacyl-[acyl-carrier-protein] synthase II